MGARKCSGKKKDRGIRRVDEKGRKYDEGKEDSSQSDSDDTEVELKRISEVHVVPAKFVKTSGKSPRYQVSVVIKEKPVVVFADTGADVSVVSFALATKLGLPLVKTKTRIRPYGAKECLKSLGYYMGPVMYKDVVVNVGMHVVDGDVEALLSGRAAEALGILTFHGKERKLVRRSAVAKGSFRDNILSKFPDVFNGVGKLEGYQVTLHVDGTVPPVAHAPRPVPFHLKGLLNKEIQTMEDCGVIEDHEGPAPWLSNIVLVPMDDGGVRVTIYMHHPNRAIMDTKVPIPRAEDIRAKLPGV